MEHKLPPVNINLGEKWTNRRLGVDFGRDFRRDPVKRTENNREISRHTHIGTAAGVLTHRRELGKINVVFHMTNIRPAQAASCISATVAQW